MRHGDDMRGTRGLSTGDVLLEGIHVRRSREYDLPVDRIRLLVLDELAIVEWERDLLLRDRSDTRVDVLSQGMSERSERGLR